RPIPRLPAWTAQPRATRRLGSELRRVRVRLGSPAGARARRGAGHPAGPGRAPWMDDLARRAPCVDRRRRPHAGPRTHGVTDPAPCGRLAERNDMAEISRASLFGKLNPLMYKAVEGAVAFCKLRGNPRVELAHWLFQIVNLPDSDVHHVVRHFDLDAARLVADLQATLERLPRGASGIEDFSEHVPEAVKEGWMYGTLLYGDAQVRSGYLLIGILKYERLREVLLRISKEFAKIKVEALTDEFVRIVKGSPEEAQIARDGFTTASPAEGGTTIPQAAMGKQEALQRFASDLTARARAGSIDPVTGRDEEIRQIIDILMRRRQNNPILTGEA